jgi:hypothetical protein
MTDSHWTRAAAYSTVVAVAAIGYVLAQTTIDASRAKLPIIAYIDCLQKFETIIWPSSPDREGGLSITPSGSAVCKDLSDRVPVAD